MADLPAHRTDLETWSWTPTGGDGVRIEHGRLETGRGRAISVLYCPPTTIVTPAPPREARCARSNSISARW